MQDVVQQGDAVEEHPFCRPVDGADAIGAFEHDMFQIVRHAGIVGGVVFGAGMHADGAMDLRFLVIFTKQHVHPVGEGDLPDGHSLRKQAENKEIT